MIPAATLFDPLPTKAVGATLRAARFAAAPDVPAQGVCVLLNGQTEFIEKYFEVIDELRGRRFAVATMDWRGQGGSTRMTVEGREPQKFTVATQLVTSDPQRFERSQMLLREHPDLRLAGATWGWLAAALRSMDWLRGQASAITTPLLIVGAGKDRICVTPEAKKFAHCAPDADYVEIAEAGHEILMERNAIRAKFWLAFDAFMKKHRAPV